MKTETEPKYEACARCGRYHQLIQVLKLWLQPRHECATEFQDFEPGLADAIAGRIR